MYRLEGEADLTYKILVTMDGNDSLKRILRREHPPDVPDDTDANNTDANRKELGQSRELEDSRVVGGDYYLTRAQVNKWAKVTLESLLPPVADSPAEDPVYNPCAERWHNMINDVTSKMWGIFDETGIFLALCRHGFVLVVADMVKSGEL
jgi:hypothetical protein